jgi:hypothetical protein
MTRLTIRGRTGISSTESAVRRRERFLRATQNSFPRGRKIKLSTSSRIVLRSRSANSLQRDTLPLTKMLFFQDVSSATQPSDKFLERMLKERFQTTSSITTRTFSNVLNAVGSTGRAPTKRIWKDGLRNSSNHRLKGSKGFRIRGASAMLETPSTIEPFGVYSNQVQVLVSHVLGPLNPQILDPL